jgi:mono/diheme cytochrome c family protein
MVFGAMAVAAANLLSATAVFASETGGAKSAIGPVVKTYKGDKCVEPTEEMRRNHMKKILHQRDETMHKGIRTQKYSLKNCVDCHADPKTNSVLGKDGFCESCHVYASVSIDCFSCHSAAPEKNGQPPKAANPSGLVEKMHTSAVMGTANGNQP